SNMSSSQCSYLLGIRAPSMSFPKREFLTHSQRTTPAAPSRETRTQPVPPQDGHKSKGCGLTGCIVHENSKGEGTGSQNRGPRGEFRNFVSAERRWLMLCVS